MARFIELSKIRSEQSADHDDAAYRDTDEPGEPQGAAGEPAAPVVHFDRTLIQVEAIRCFYPRKDNRPGTRITFTDGGGFAVTEDFDAVKGLVQPN